MAKKFYAVLYQNGQGKIYPDYLFDNIQKMAVKKYVAAGGSGSKPLGIL